MMSMNPMVYIRDRMRFRFRCVDQLNVEMLIGNLIGRQFNFLKISICQGNATAVDGKFKLRYSE